MLIIGGVAVPLESLPDWAQRLSSFFPGRYAVESIKATVMGDGLGAARFSVAALLLIGLAGCLAGARLFRWDAQQRFAAYARQSLGGGRASGLAGRRPGRRNPSAGVVASRAAGRPAPAPPRRRRRWPLRPATAAPVSRCSPTRRPRPRTRPGPASPAQPAAPAKTPPAAPPKPPSARDEGSASDTAGTAAPPAAPPPEPVKPAPAPAPAPAAQGDWQKTHTRGHRSRDRLHARSHPTRGSSRRSPG